MEILNDSMVSNSAKQGTTKRPLLLKVG